MFVILLYKFLQVLNSWPKLKPGGVFSGHDYSEKFPGVIKAVKEFEKETGMKTERFGTNWWCICPQ
jgi:hypothetical protein